MTDPSRCLYCGAVHRSEGDECFPSVDRLFTLLYEAEDEVNDLQSKVERLTLERDDARVEMDHLRGVIESKHGGEPLALIDELDAARHEVKRWRSLVSEALLSADCTWETSLEGNDWAEWCAAARSALAEECMAYEDKGKRLSQKLGEARSECDFLRWALRYEVRLECGDVDEYIAHLRERYERKLGIVQPPKLEALVTIESLREKLNAEILKMADMLSDYGLTEEESKLWGIVEGLKRAYEWTGKSWVPPNRV